MSSYDVVLFVHIAVLLAAFGLSGVLHGSEWLMARSATVAELRVTARPQKLGPLFAFVLLALLGSGFSLLRLSENAEEFDLGDPFVWTAVVVLVLLFLDGPLILGRHEAALSKLLSATPNGPVTPELRAMTHDRTVWLVAYMNTFAVLAVVLNMATKPSLVLCVVDVLAGAGVGLVVALFGLSRARLALPPGA